MTFCSELGLSELWPSVHLLLTKLGACSIENLLYDSVYRLSEQSIDGKHIVVYGASTTIDQRAYQLNPVHHLFQLGVFIHLKVLISYEGVC